MAIIDNTLASKVDTFNPATPLMQAAQVQNAQAEAQATQFKMQQQELGAEMRGLKPYMNTPEFAGKWAETADRLVQRGVIDPGTHEKWRNTPSPLLMQSVIAKTSDPALDFRKEEAAREQKNTDRTFANTDRNFAFTVEQAKEKPSIQKLKGNDGEERLVQVTPQGTVRKLDTGEVPPANPYANGKQTEAQSKDGLYASRIMESENILRGVEAAGTDPWEKAKSKVPLVGNYLVSGDYQKYDQAQRDFINATLRRESGAVIADSEFANANKQYFPQPGDKPDTIAQKQRNRAEAARGIAAGAGQSYSPPYTFGPNNELIPNDKKAKGAAGKAAAPKAVATKADFDALPSGSQFVAPDGSVRVKP